jgi:hypothetical protein
MATRYDSEQLLNQSNFSVPLRPCKRTLFDHGK